MTSEDVQDLNSTENDMVKHLKESLALWNQILKFYAATEPDLYFDLAGDPPAWVTAVHQEMVARNA